jgi:prepilin-type N-terminal cleavage/methylation domain-containing protein
MSKRFKPYFPEIKRIAGGFTLVEVLVAVAILSIITLILLSITGFTTKIWQQGESQKNRDQSARIQLESISRDLQSTVMPVLPTYPAKATPVLRFLVNPSAVTDVANPFCFFWQASLPNDGTDSDIHDVGYFIRWLNDGPSSHPVHAVLCRLTISASDSNSIFNNPGAGSWPTDAILNATTPGDQAHYYKGFLADNVIGLWLTLYDQNGVQIPVGSTGYDSGLAVRPVTSYLAAIEVALVIIDQSTALRINSASMITSHYTAATVDQFVQALPTTPPIRQGARIYRTRVALGASH